MWRRCLPSVLKVWNQQNGEGEGCMHKVCHFLPWVTLGWGQALRLTPPSLLIPPTVPCVPTHSASFSSPASLSISFYCALTMPRPVLMPSLSKEVGAQPPCCASMIWCDLWQQHTNHLNPYIIEHSKSSAYFLLHDRQGRKIVLEFTEIKDFVIFSLSFLTVM